MKSVEIEQGNDYVFTITVTDGSTGNPKNLTNVLNIIYRLASSQTDQTFDVDKDLGSPDIQVTDAVNGVYEVKLTSAETALLVNNNYYHESQVEDENNLKATTLSEKIKMRHRIIL